MNSHYRKKIHTIIFETDTPMGKLFDLLLIGAIIFSVILILLESISSVRTVHQDLLFRLEWLLTILFILEYILRIYSVEKPFAYIFSFFGIVDFVSSFATVAAIFLPGTQSLIVVRSLRLLRIFRILKLGRYFSEGMVIVDALKASRIKIFVFIFSVLIIVLLAGTLMHLIEGAESGFENIPISMYWAIVTLTTVGYGDLAPVTNLGRFVSSLLMILGYAIIAVPTGIVTSELTKGQSRKALGQACPGCGRQGHGIDADYCYACGTSLN